MKVLLLPEKEDYDFLNKELGLGHYCDQDWELLQSDPDRLEDFMILYESGRLNEVRQVALMDLIIASYDNLLEKYGHEDLIWKRICSHLQKNEKLHWYTTFYWSLEFEGEDYEEGWEVTEKMRRLKGL